MEWSDEGIVLSARRHGESGAVVILLTREHGRHAGLVHGGASRRARGLFEVGNRVQAAWRARLAEHLGHFSCELLESYAAAVLDDPLRLSALTAATAVADASLPEREPHPRAYDGLRELLETLETSPSDQGIAARWSADYVRWELALLADLGFGLDLSCCAATGSREELAYVSPKTGRAVSATAGAPYRDQLLPLPAFLAAETAEPADAPAVLAGLRLTGFFLDRHVFSHSPGGAGAASQAPAARERFIQRLRNAAS
ncbi:DNA repair protein RecO [Rhodospirillaceae bacterium SYSU D60014]|uniref:DNA repair protein RecO n=1 Tax=Virgifigura deserti TaxID=2268457 RepID=UPI000E66F9FB